MRRRRSLESSSETCLKVERVAEKRETWRRVKGEGIGGMKSEWEKTGRRYTWPKRKWRELSPLPHCANLPVCKAGSARRRPLSESP